MNRVYYLNRNGGIKKIELSRRSISEYSADAIVCPATTDLDFPEIPKRVDIYEQILDRAGGEVFTELGKAGAEYFLSHPISLDNQRVAPLGSVHLTSAGRLPFKAIIHAVDMDMGFIGKTRMSLTSNVAAIAEGTRNALDLVKEKGFKSVGFNPLGRMGRQSGLIPLRIGLDAMGREFFRHFDSPTPIERVGLVLYDLDSFELAQEVFDRI